MPVDPPEPMPSDDRRPPYDAGEPLWAHSIGGDLSGVPMARPVMADSVLRPLPGGWYLWPARLPAGSAALQLAMIIGVAVFAAVIGMAVLKDIRLSDPRWRQLLEIGVVAAACIVTVFLVVWSKGQSAGTIGWRTDSLGLDIAIGAVSTIFILVAIAAISILLFAIDPDPSRSEEARKAIGKAIPSMSLPVTVLVMFLVAVWEETIFRGFLLTRLHAIVKRWWLAIPLGAVIFAVPHSYEGKMGMALVGGLGIVLGVLFVWRKSLVPCIVCHMLFNIAIMLFMRLAAQGLK